MGLFRRRPSTRPSTSPSPGPSGSSGSSGSSAGVDATPPGGIARPSEIDQLRADLMAMQARLDEVAAERAALQGHVQSLTERLSAPLPSPPPDASPAARQRDLDVLRAQVVRLGERVESADAAGSSGTQPSVELSGRLEALENWVVQSADDLAGRLHALDTALARSTAELAERLEGVDARVTHVSAELANQVSELGTELDELARRADAAPPSDDAREPVATIDQAALDELLTPIRDAQGRLANEQARYQIAFREDLAELADRLRRA
jgi:septal ring factor EnvC (AmiA/AmiB activator)